MGAWIASLVNGAREVVTSSSRPDWASWLLALAIAVLGATIVGVLVLTALIAAGVITISAGAGLALGIAGGVAVALSAFVAGLAFAFFFLLRDPSLVDRLSGIARTLDARVGGNAILERWRWLLLGALGFTVGALLPGPALHLPVAPPVERRMPVVSPAAVGAPSRPTPVVAPSLARSTDIEGDPSPPPEEPPRVGITGALDEAFGPR